MIEHTRTGVVSCAVAGVLAAVLAVGCGGGDGRSTTAWKASAQIPDDFPKDIPVYPGATLRQAVTPERGTGMVVYWETTDKVPAVEAYLTKEMEAQGWKVASVKRPPTKWLGEEGQSVTTITGTRWGRQISFGVSAKDAKTVITLVIGWKP